MPPRTLSEHAAYLSHPPIVQRDDCRDCAPLPSAAHVSMARGASTKLLIILLIKQAPKADGIVTVILQ